MRSKEGCGVVVRVLVDLVGLELMIFNDKSNKGLFETGY